MAIETKKFNVAVIGPEDMISGFKTLGVKIFNILTQGEMLTQVKDLRRSTISEDNGEKYAVIMVMEDLLKDLPKDEYERITQGPLPVILSIPGISSDNSVSTKKLKVLAEKAIGSDILS